MKISSLAPIAIAALAASSPVKSNENDLHMVSLDRRGNAEDLFNEFNDFLGTLVTGLDKVTEGLGFGVANLLGFKTLDLGKLGKVNPDPIPAYVISGVEELVEGLVEDLGDILEAVGLRFESPVPKIAKKN